MSAMDLSPRAILRPATRLGAAAQNALEVARFGGLDGGQQRSPFVVAGEDRIHRLRHYGTEASAEPGPEPSPEPGAEPAPESGGEPLSAPVLLIPPMMLAADIYDVSPSASAVAMLRAAAIDPWVIDFGSPEEQPGGLERTLADHVVAISAAVDRIGELTGRDVHVGGYSQGGMFAYEVAALRGNEGIASLITFGSPVDTREGMPFGVPEQLASNLAGFVADRVFGGRALPAWASRAGFQMIDPVRSARNRLEFISQLHDREALLEREGQRRFLEADGWVAWPGPAMADFLRQFIAANRLLDGGFVVDGRLLTLADLTVPILAVVGALDEIAPAPGVRAIREAASKAPVYELMLPGGHFGLVVGESARERTWPVVADWVRWRDSELAGSATGEGNPTSEPPAPIAPIPDRAERERAQDEADVRDRVGYGLELAGGVGAGIARSAVGTVRRTARGARDIGRVAGQLPRLARLEGLGADTRISLGSMLEERRRQNPEEVLFLFGERAHTAGSVNRRIDDAVRGLIAIGVRQGEHVGVLMGSHPGALAVLAAISRIGAVAVMLRPDGDTHREAALARVRRIVADPSLAAQAASARVTVHTFELHERSAGGGPISAGDPGLTVTIGAEPVDVATVRLPRWYRPDPGRVSELAFILFTAEGEAIRMSRITNGRWVTAALGTASSAALSSSDTVYCVTPAWHPSTLFMSVGGAIAGGARVALAAGEPQDAGAFWDEVRRCGATVASYTWAMLDGLVNAAPQPGERHHPLRLFIGSGMPRGLWRRVQERFAPARVLEFYASTETGAILVNLSGAKAGAMGRRLPGSPEVRLAAYDPVADQLELGHGGFVRSSRTDEPGMLLTRARRRDSVATTPLRGVFGADDAWLSTGDLFRRDADGDYWRLDSARELILTPRGPVYAGTVRDALGDLPEVDLVAVFGLRIGSRREELAVAAVSLREDRAPEARSVTTALGALPAGVRPDVVRVVESIPMTTWFRPMTGPLREQGLPDPSAAGALPTWYLDRGGERYRPLTTSARRRLTSAS
jgi:putative long chain acyl-CoA synthase